VEAIELDESRKETLVKLVGEENLDIGDFLTMEPHAYYDAIIMNPPFSNNQNIDHVRRAYE
jgi:tRNA1(Val) A37 N6-methylase TrmN6